MREASILVVEDEFIVRADIERHLVALGYRVAGRASTAEEAITQARDAQPDLVLMDIHLRGAMDGIDAAEIIRTELDIPVVFLTAYGDSGTLARAELSEPFGYLLKPFAERELGTAVWLGLYRHQNERALRERESFLTTLFEAIPSSVLVLAEDGEVVMANSQAQKTFHLDQLEAEGVTLRSVLRCAQKVPQDHCTCETPCERCDILRSVDDALAGARIHRRRAEIGLAIGGSCHPLVLMISAAALTHNGRRQVVLIMEDTTELTQLRSLLGGERSFAGMVGRSPEMQLVFSTIREVAEVEVPVLVQGETGTGKELAARAIHDHGPRSSHSFVPVNCGAIPDGLLESELFGHLKGSFTGAVRDRKGRFTLADRGTIFLDEIGDLNPSVQVKLLRVLQERSFEPVGSDRAHTVDVRVISATNKNLLAEVEAGRFRKDLYYRLCVVPIELPPLRHRPGDLPLLVEHLLEREAAATGARRLAVAPEVMAAFVEHGWPGNVRELQNVLQYARIKAQGGTIELEHLPPSFGRSDELLATGSLSGARNDLSRGALLDALRRAGGNRTRAAELLGISRATLYRHLARLS